MRGYAEGQRSRARPRPRRRALRRRGSDAGAERAAINAPMQGTAADLIKMAMVATQRWVETEKLRSRLIMQVHDELVLDVVSDELELVCENLPRLMCQVAELSVPLLAEVGQGSNWEQAH